MEPPRGAGLVSPRGTVSPRGDGNVTFAAVALAGLASLFGSAGCARCSDEPRVPFKLKPVAVVDAGAAEVEDASAPPPSTFAQAVDQPLLSGSPLPVLRVRAVLERDLDGDGDLDPLVVSEDESQRARVQVVPREPGGFGTPHDVSGVAASPPAGCSIASATLEALSSGKAVLALGFACADAPTPSTVRTSLALLTLEQLPRIHERLDVLGATHTGEPPLTLRPSSVDADGDGHDDVRVMALAAGQSEADALSLVWLDRPSGLVRDGREPEATLAAWANAAQSLAASAPDQALARAALALSLQRALCRELGEPVIALSGTPGVPCGPSPATTQLLATRVAAEARRGNLANAFESYRALRRAEPKASERTLTEASAALAKLPARAQVTLRRGPAVEPASTPRLHLPSARFIGESTLYVHRASPVFYDLLRAEETAATGAGDLLLRDPSGQLIATAIERTCDGLGVRIERAPPPGSDYVSGAALAHAVLVPMASAPGCTRSTTRADDAGWALLGWAPQGLVAARGSEVRVVPLASDGRASAPARVLAPEAPRPAPLPSGTATSDGGHWVEATAHGVLVYGPRSTDVELWRPDGYAAIAKGPLEAAISPSARRAAVVAGGAVYVLERADAPR